MANGPNIFQKLLVPVSYTLCRGDLCDDSKKNSAFMFVLVDCVFNLLVFAQNVVVVIGVLTLVACDTFPTLSGLVGGWLNFSQKY